MISEPFMHFDFLFFSLTVYIMISTGQQKRVQPVKGVIFSQATIHHVTLPFTYRGIIRNPTLEKNRISFLIKARSRKRKVTYTGMRRGMHSKQTM